MAGAMEIVFVLAPSQNRFFFEMADALIFELSECGVSARISTSGFPPQRRGLVYVLFPPHEYFVLEGYRRRVDEDLLKRTLFISAEQPQSSHFADNVRLSEFAGRVFDINAAAVRAYRWRGVDAQPVALGYSRHLDHYEPETERHIDVLFMGCMTSRRARVLAGCGSLLSRNRSRIVLSDNSRPNTATSSTFVAGEEKFALLKSSELILNIHQTEEPYFEWARVLDAIHSGCVVISEHSTDYSPLVPGEHFVSARPESVALALERLLGDPDLVSGIRKRAYDSIRSELPLANAAQQLAEAAEEIDVATARTAPGPVAETLATIEAGTNVDLPEQAIEFAHVSEEQVSPVPLFSDSDPELAAVRRALKEIRLDLTDLRRLANRAILASQRERLPVVEPVRTSPAYALNPRPRVSVLTALYNHGSEIVEALDSLILSDYTDWEIVVVNDGSQDNGVDAVSVWSDRHPEIPLQLVSHPVNRGLAHARNTALAHARGELAFVLDSDNGVFPKGIGNLVATLDSHPDATFAYGMLASFRNGAPYGLVSAWPWESDRLRLGNYVDAMAIFRMRALRALGGYSTDRRLYGWEDYDLYCRLAERGHHGVFVDNIVATYRSSDTSMLAVTNISHSAAFVALKEHAPVLMAQVLVPD